MTDYCKCGGKIALCTTYITSAEPDQEPYENGKIEECIGNAYDGREINFKPVGVAVHVCSSCGKVTSCESTEFFGDLLSGDGEQ